LGGPIALLAFAALPLPQSPVNDLGTIQVDFQVACIDTVVCGHDPRLEPSLHLFQVVHLQRRSLDIMRILVPEFKLVGHNFVQILVHN
jgi:hypothetical protein